jgi:hypothetical protein
MLAKVLHMGLQDSCHLGRGGKSHFFTKEKVLNSHALKNKGGPAWDIFHGCMKELAMTHVYVFFKVTSLTLGKSFIFYTHMFTLQTNELINPAKFIPIYIIELHRNTNVCIHQAKLFVFLVQQNHSPYTCMFLQALWLPNCIFHLFGFFGFLSLFIHMQVPCSLKPCIIGC